MGEDDLGIFACLEGQESYAAGEIVENVFLNDAVHKLMYLLGTALDLYGTRK